MPPSFSGWDELDVCLLDVAIDSSLGTSSPDIFLNTVFPRCRWARFCLFVDRVEWTWRYVPLMGTGSTSHWVEYSSRRHSLDQHYTGLNIALGDTHWINMGHSLDNITLG